MTTPNSMIRRDVVRRLAEQGKLEVVSSYHFDDLLGASRSSDTMPVVFVPADQTPTYQDGVVYLRPSHFTGDAGRAWRESNGLITLHVHSNLNFTLRVKPVSYAIGPGLLRP